MTLQTQGGASFVDNYKAGLESSQQCIVGFASGEIGGCNSMEPLIYGGDLNLPVIDCDGMGRAFPELQVCVCSFKESELWNYYCPYFVMQI